MKKNLTPFGKEVKKALVDKEMTQRALAEAAGTTPGYLNLILGGDRPPGKYLTKIAEILDLDVQNFQNIA